MKKILYKNILLILILILNLNLMVGCTSIESTNNLALNKTRVLDYDKVKDSLIRFHVIANSDTDEDQALKYKVRDALLEYMNSICKDVPSKQEAMDIANSHIDDFYAIAEKVIKENGYDYPVNITLGKSDFPTKNYGDVSLPAGTYDALRVEIGSASGRNWWCVMFPPLCFVDVSSGVVPDSSKELLQNNMSEEDYDLITDDNSSSELTFKFKLVELFENWRLQLASK